MTATCGKKREITNNRAYFSTERERKQMDRKSPNVVDFKMFMCVKALIRSGETQKNISEYMNIGEATVSRISCAEDWEDYMNRKLEAVFFSQQRKAQKKAAQAPAPAPQPVPQVPVPTPEPQPQIVEHRTNVTLQTTHYVSQKMDELIKLMTGISAKLAFVVDELTGTPIVKKEEKQA